MLHALRAPVAFARAVHLRPSLRPQGPVAFTDQTTGPRPPEPVDDGRRPEPPSSQTAIASGPSKISSTSGSGSGVRGHAGPLENATCRRSSSHAST